MFKDHFSARPAEYARYRPGYPDTLFEFLAACCEHRRLAWDCATGNGQAAVSLGRHFDAVIATDASATQIDSALKAPSVVYRVAPAEASGITQRSVDLVTVGQALHWFDLPRFFAEVRRVLVEGGVLAVWSYALCEVDNECDALVQELYRDITGDYWPPERRLVEHAYADIAIPGQAVDTPSFEMRLDWPVRDMLGYLRTWSAVKRYEAAEGKDPVAHIEDRLIAAWGSGSRSVVWPLKVLVSRL